MIWALAAALAILVAAPLLMERLRRPMDARGRRMAAGDFVELSRGLTYYEWRGPARGPVVVCIHGLTTPSYVWAPVAVALTALGVRVLTYDLYGRGLSDRPAGRQDRAFFVTQLDELLTALEITRAVTLLGYSMGGAIATAFAQDKPARVDRLVLVAPVGLGHRLSRFLTFCAAVPVIGDGLVRVFGDILYRRGIDYSLPDNPEVPDMVARMAGEMGTRGTLPAVLSSLRGMVAEDMAPVHRALAETSLPVLAIWGEADKVIPLAAMGRLAQINRRARQVELSGATHALPYTHPDDILGALTDLLREPV
ncbi:MAG: alpha/beta fold hydrolase [Rhodobacteraceae bacterium]|nr:alpha/beta fold hydrolase [Paracoccaceae bacterium]